MHARAHPHSYARAHKRPALKLRHVCAGLRISRLSLPRPQSARVAARDSISFPQERLKTSREHTDMTRDYMVMSRERTVRSRDHTGVSHDCTDLSRHELPGGGDHEFSSREPVESRNAAKHSSWSPVRVKHHFGRTTAHSTMPRSRSLPSFIQVNAHVSGVHSCVVSAHRVRSDVACTSVS